MRLDLIRRPVLNVDPSAIGLPARNAGSEPLVRISNPAIVFFFEFVFVGIRRRIAPPPELLNELFPLLVVGKPRERLPLLIADDIGDIPIQPRPVWRLEFSL